jgi:hypothetical protein
MIKLCYPLWPHEPLSPMQRRERLLGDVAPALLRSQSGYLQINIDDDLAQVRSPAPRPLFRQPFVAQVSLWLPDESQRAACEDVLRRSGFDLAGYRVDEQLYTEYGENAHAPARDWPDGRRSPGVLTVTWLERLPWLDKDEWTRRWLGRQSPLSEAMQPRARYVRNAVLAALTSGAPPCEGIVEEAWPSARHVTDPYLFYGARNPLQLTANMARMLYSVASFLPLWNITTVTMSEYFLRTPFDPARGTYASTPADLPADASAVPARRPAASKGPNLGVDDGMDER